jgi:hypothetical protein
MTPAVHRRPALVLGRGECEGLQVWVEPGAKNVTAALTPLRSGTASLEVTLYREAYVPVRTPSNAQGATGLWPDPLIPARDAYRREERSALPADSTAEKPLVLYFELCAPKAQAPGTYEGAVTLSATGRPKQRLELTAEVMPYALPATSSLPNSFGLSLLTVAKGHRLPPESPEAQRLLRDYATAALIHRISLHGMSMSTPPARFEKGKALVDFSAYDREVGPFLEGTAHPSGARFTTSELRKPLKAWSAEQRRAYFRAFADHFRAKGWPALLFYYAKDEPKKPDYPFVLSEAADVHASTQVPVLVTSHWVDALKPATDIAAPCLNCFFERPGPQTCYRVAAVPTVRSLLRRREGRVWWYQSCNSHGCTGGPAAKRDIEAVYSGWASYMVDHSGPMNRAMGPLAFLSKVDGELYFDTVHAMGVADAWENVFFFGGNGDGTFFYPGTPERVGGKRPTPIESLRLKHLRDGLEDYEYFTLLASLGDAALAQSSALALTPSGYQIEADVARWESVRLRMARRLAELWRSKYPSDARVTP